MELKLPNYDKLTPKEACFNCTFMELKSREGKGEASQERALIVPLWN